MNDQIKSTRDLGKAFFALSLVPIALAWVAVAVLFSPVAVVFAEPVLISVLVLAVVFTILYFLFLQRFIDCVCDKGQ